MKGELNLPGNFSAEWIKYENYVFRNDNKGNTYIVPEDGTFFSMYNPFDVSEEILTDILRIGISSLSDDKNTDALLLLFAKKYGLLGFISSSVYNKNILGDDFVIFSEGNPVTKEKIMKTEDYIKTFIPFATEYDVEIRKYKNTVDVIKSEDSPKYYGKKPLVTDLIFSKFYCEDKKWILNFAENLSRHFDNIITYRNTSSFLTESVTIMGNVFHSEKIGFTIDQLDKTFISWKFDSLKTIIEIIYAFSVTENKNILNKCNSCGNFFIAATEREKYCSPACRNRENVKKSRQRNKKNITE